MKKMVFIAIATVLTTLPMVALACPDLAGTYECLTSTSAVGIFVGISEQSSSYDVSISGLLSGLDGAFKGGNYELSKDGQISPSLEGINYSSIDVKSVCEGNNDLRLDGTYNDSVLGAVHMVKRIFKDQQGFLHRDTQFILANGSIQKGPSEICHPEQFGH